MSRRTRLRTFGLIAMLLPGLALAAPIAGPCGMCDSGMPCPSMAEAPAKADAHSCCGGEADQAPAAPSLGSSNCDCGRDAPAATAVDAAPTQETASSDAPRDAQTVAIPDTAAVVVGGRDEPAPPPFPPVFLIDCSFLT